MDIETNIDQESLKKLESPQDLKDIVIQDLKHSRSLVRGMILSEVIILLIQIALLFWLSNIFHKLIEDSFNTVITLFLSFVVGSSVFNKIESIRSYFNALKILDKLDLSVHTHDFIKEFTDIKRESKGS